MVGLIIGLCMASHDPENRSDRPLAWGKDSTSEEGVIALFPIACAGSGKRKRDERLTSNRHE